MAAYMIADLEPIDGERLREYAQRNAPLLERYGGRILVRRGRCEVLEGDWRPLGIMLIEFPSFERAMEWYNSPEYQEIGEIRYQHARTAFLAIVEGA